MFPFFKKNITPPISFLNEEEKIEMLARVYDDFLKKLSTIERDRDERISEILRAIDERKVRDILHNAVVS